MINSIEEIIKNNKWIYGLVIAHLLFLIILAKLSLFQYETMDDFYQLAYFSGMFGEYSPFVMFSNVIYGLIMTFLFKVLPIINWMTFMYVAISYIAYNCIFSVFIKNSKTKVLGVIASLIIFFTSYQYIYLEMNFSKIALLAIAGGLVLLIDAVNNEKFQKREILGYFLICWGCLLREKVAAMVLAFLIVPIIFYVRNKKIDKHKIIMLCMILVLFLTTWGINKIAYNVAGWSDAVYREHITRGMRDYDTLPEEIWGNIDWDYVGFDEEDMLFLTGWHFADTNVFSDEALERLCEYEQHITFSIEYFVQVIKETLYNCLAHSVFIVAFFICVIAFIVCKNYRIEILAIVILMGVESLYLVYNNRYPDRVALIPWVMCAVFILYILCKTVTYSFGRNRSGYIVLVLMNLVMLYAIATNYNLYISEWDSQDKDINDYVTFIADIDTTDSDDLYIENYTSGPFGAYSIFECPDYGIWSDTVLDAGCMSLFPDVLTKSAKFGSDKSPYEAMILSDHVYIIDERYFWEKRTFIRKHYTVATDVSWVYSNGDFDAYSYTSPLDIDEITDIGDWSIESFGKSEIKPEFYLIAGNVTENNDASIYYIKVSGDVSGTYYYEVRVENGQYVAGIPVDTWMNDTELEIKMIEKVDDIVIESDNEIIIEK